MFRKFFGLNLSFMNLTVADSNSSYNRLGKNANENDIEEIIDMANKASVKDRWRQVQENVHFQFKSMCQVMDEILLPDTRSINGKPCSSPPFQSGPLQSGLSFAVRKGTPNNEPG